MIRLKQIERAHLPLSVDWRNSARAGLRTPTVTSIEGQLQWLDALQDKRSHDRYWAGIDECGVFSSVVGLTGIQWENGAAEVSLLADPLRTKQGIGQDSLRAVLSEGFDRMRLLTIYGECYTNNPAIGFWRKMLEEFGGTSTTLPRRKFWDGQLHDSLYFTFTVDAWRETQKGQ